MLPRTKVLVLSMHKEAVYVRQILESRSARLHPEGRD